MELLSVNTNFKFLVISSLNCFSTPNLYKYLSLFITMLFQSELYPQNAHYRHQIDTIQTPMAQHYNYQIYYNDLPVFQAYKQVHIFNITGHQLEQNNWPIKIIPLKNISDANAFLLNNDSLIPVLFTVSDDSLFWHNTESGLVLSRPVGNNTKDTFATVKVFKPNPINSSGKSG